MFFKTVLRTGTNDSHKKWELPNSGKYPALVVTCGTVILSHNRFFPHGSTLTNLCSKLLAWALVAWSSVFFFFSSIFWWNLTKRKRRFNRVYSREKNSKFFSISLSKNGEISQERKTLVPWSCFLSVNGESLPFVIWMCILPILENLLEISSKIHSLINQYAYCHAAVSNANVSPARHDLGCTKRKLTSSKETSWDVDIPKFGRLIYKSSRKLPDPTTTWAQKKEVYSKCMIPCLSIFQLSTKLLMTQCFSMMKIQDNP